MTIGEVLDAIKNVNADFYVRFDFGGVAPTKVDSWRGIYAEAAIGFSSGDYGDSGCTVGAFRQELLGALERPYTGWKGGYYEYTRGTPLHVDNRGKCTNTEIERIEVTNWNVMIHTEHQP